MGILTDPGGQSIIDNMERLKHLKLIDLEHHFLSNEMMNQLKKTDLNINLKDSRKDGYREVAYYITTFD